MDPTGGQRFGIRPWPCKRLRGPITDSDRSWWGFQPLSPVQVPSVRDPDWARNEVDRFILSKFSSHGLTPSPEANLGVLIRRLCFDLWGLPPEPAEIDAFVKDPRPDAYERLVDRLLDSPRYGERWARHWLDLVRYADSDGYKADDFRPTAWRYRDYVVDALNADKPYDRFVREQLAGDELYPDDPEALAATGYLRCGIYEYNNRDVAGQWSTILNDITDTTGDVFLGLGLQCARCHDHKFDPLLRKDYYRLQAAFAGIQLHDDLPLADASTRLAWNEQGRAWEEQTAALRGEIDSLLAPYRTKSSETAISKFPPAIQAILRQPESKRSPLERQLGALAHRQLAYEHERLVSQLKPADKERHGSLQRALAEFNELKPAPLPITLTVRDVGPVAPETFIPGHPEEPIAPGFPSVLDPAPLTPLRQGSTPTTTGRRAALAIWLTRPDHPLTSRVLVNRVWQHHFGRGLVPTSSDFGRLGELPSHPALLDWLARRFVADGWSLKSLHRLLVNSATYRQASSLETIGPDRNRRPRRPETLESDWKRAVEIDPENQWCWRGRTRRLDAEQIRDALLQATGELRTHRVPGAADASQFHRSIHSKVLRNARDPLLDVFDVPQQFASAAARDVTTTPIQSLLLINSPFMLDRARALASRLEAAVPGRTQEAVGLAYLLTLGRRPTATEVDDAVEFIQRQVHRVDPELAQSATAGFRSERMPFRNGRAGVFTPRSSQETLSAPLTGRLHPGPVTLEAFVYLRSLPEDGSPRVLAHLGDASGSGWTVGVTGRKSRHRIQSLMVEVARTPNPPASPVLDEVCSDLVLHTDKPYYVGVTVGASPGGPTTVTFRLKDLSNDEDPLQTVELRVDAGAMTVRDPLLTLGGRRNGEALWDGLIDDTRLTGATPAADRLLWVHEGTPDPAIGFWRFEAKPSPFLDGSGRGHELRPARKMSLPRSDARLLAMADFCHALLNSSGFLFVE